MSYQTTQVPVARSQEAIRQMLIKFGARGVQFTEDFESRQVGIRFAKEINKQMRTVNVSLTVPEAEQPKRKRTTSFRRGRIVYSKTTQDRQEQMTRAAYRALHDWLKAQFVAVEYGLLSFEDVFLSHFEWMIGGQVSTIGQLVKPKLEGTLLPTHSSASDDILDGEVE